MSEIPTNADLFSPSFRANGQLPRFSSEGPFSAFRLLPSFTMLAPTRMTRLGHREAQVRRCV